MLDLHIAKLIWPFYNKHIHLMSFGEVEGDGGEAVFNNLTMPLLEEWDKRD